MKGITLKTCLLCSALINSVISNLLCVCIFYFFIYVSTWYILFLEVVNIYMLTCLIPTVTSENWLYWLWKRFGVRVRANLVLHNQNGHALRKAMVVVVPLLGVSLERKCSHWTEYINCSSVLWIRSSLYSSYVPVCVCMCLWFKLWQIASKLKTDWWHF